jgi:hypothetical protein
MQQVQFYYLQRPIQERFIESTHGKGAPIQLLFQPPGPNPVALVLGITSGVLFAACVVFACLGFGSLEHNLALNPSSVLVVYAALLCFAIGTLLKATHLWNRDAMLPFRRGVHAFPAVLVDARKSMLEVHRMTELKEVVSSSNRVILQFTDGGAFQFENVDLSRFEEIKAKLKDAQQRLSAPPSSTFGRDQALLDPLADSGFKSLFSSNEPMKPPAMAWVRYWPLIAVVLGITCGFALWKTRNALSAKQLYIRARALNTTHGYQMYLARGGSRKDVRELLLPRAELRDAMASGSVDAIEHFMDAHENSKINNEANVALYRALLRDLDKARAVGTLAALREFRKGDPRVSLVGSERVQAERALYRAALARFKSESSGTPELAAFVPRLIAWAEQHGPKVEIRFRRKMPSTAVMIETQLQKNPYFGGSKSLPIQYFDAKHSEAREALIASAISKRFGAVFPRDIISFEYNPTPVEDDAGAAALPAATMLITHTTNMVSVFTSRKPRGAFAGIAFAFKAQILIPGDTAPLSFVASVWMAPDFKKYDESNWTPESLYEFMATEAFSQFLKKYFVFMFKS